MMWSFYLKEIGKDEYSLKISNEEERIFDHLTVRGNKRKLKKLLKQYGYEGRVEWSRYPGFGRYFERSEK